MPVRVCEKSWRFTESVIREMTRLANAHGACCAMTDISPLGAAADVTFARLLATEVGAAGVPGSSFFSDPAAGRQRLRFHFARRRETLEAAVVRLQSSKARLAAGPQR